MYEKPALLFWTPTCFSLLQRSCYQLTSPSFSFRRNWQSNGTQWSGSSNHATKNLIFAVSIPNFNFRIAVELEYSLFSKTSQTVGILQCFHIQLVSVFWGYVSSLVDTNFTSAPLLYYSAVNLLTIYRISQFRFNKKW